MIIMTPSAVTGCIDVETGALVNAQSHFQFLPFSAMQIAQFVDEFSARNRAWRSHVYGMKVQMIAATGAMDAGIDGWGTKNRNGFNRSQNGFHLSLHQFKRRNNIGPHFLGRDFKRFRTASAPLRVTP